MELNSNVQESDSSNKKAAGDIFSCFRQDAGIKTINHTPSLFEEAHYLEVNNAGKKNVCMECAAP